MSYFSTDMKNKFYPGQTHTARLTLRPETHAQVMTTGIRVLFEASLAPGRYQMRIAAGNGGDRSGSVVYDRHPGVDGHIANHDDELEGRVRGHVARQHHLDARVRRGR